MAIGAAGIGGAIVGAVSTATFAAGAIGTIIATAINGALIGAAIGGISAAITGGSIGKGILFGAVGGAVTAGLGAWASGAGGAGGTLGSGVGTGSGALANATGMSMADTAAIASGSTTQFATTTGATAAQTAGNLGTSASGGILGKAGELGAGALKNSGGSIASSLVDMGGKAMEGSAMEDMQNDQQEWAAEQQAVQNALSMQLEELRSGTSLAQTGIQAEVAKRGQDITAKTAANQLQAQKDEAATERALDEERRKRISSNVAGITVQEGGALQGTSAHEQMLMNDQQMYGTA